MFESFQAQNDFCVDKIGYHNVCKKKKRLHKKYKNFQFPMAKSEKLLWDMVGKMRYGRTCLG